MLLIRILNFLIKVIIGLVQHWYLVRHLLLRVQMQIAIHMHQIVSYWIIGNQVLIIIHQFFPQLLGGLKIQLLAIQLFSKHLLINNKYQIVVQLFMHQMEQLILHLLILLAQGHLHFHLMPHIGKDIWLIKSNYNVYLVEQQFYHQSWIFIPVAMIRFTAKFIHQT